MIFPPIDHILCFGGSHLLLAVVELCKKRGLRCDVYTAPRQANEVLDPSGVTLSQGMQRLQQKYTISEDINQEPLLPDLIGPGTLGLGLGEAWSFTPEMIDRFQGRLLDFMGIPHPRYRGGAHYSWMIMRGDKEMGCHLQVINEDMVQGVHDSGELVYSHHYRLPDQCVTPLDYFHAAVTHEIDFIDSFLDRVAKGSDFILQGLDESRSMYLPRLRTHDQGWIDWTWQGEEIKRFIDAFDDPYPGAGTFLNGVQEVRCKDAQFLNDEGPFHPFQSGLITRTRGQDIVVATTAGHLRLRVLGEHSIRLGDRLLTPQSILEKARCMRATYGVD